MPSERIFHACVVNDKSCNLTGIQFSSTKPRRALTASAPRRNLGKPFFFTFLLIILNLKSLMPTLWYLWVIISCILTPENTRGHCQKATSTPTMRAVEVIAIHTYTERTNGLWVALTNVCMLWSLWTARGNWRISGMYILRTEEERARSLWRERPGCRQPTEKRNSRSH